MLGPFREADLLAMLKKMLEDPVGAVEVKFSALGLICSLANSSTCSSLRHRHGAKKHLLKYEKRKL